MATIADLLIKLGIKDDASRGLETFGAKADEAGAHTKSFGATVSETGESIAGHLGKIVAAAGLTAAAFEGGEFLKGGIEAAESLQKSQESLNIAIERTGGNVEVLQPQFEKVAKSSADFGISQESANKNLAKAVLLSGNAKSGMMAYQEAVVLSKGAHISLDAALTATAKAQAGITTSLQRYGVAVSKGTSGQEQYRMIMQRWGGQAQANTLDSDRLNAKFQNMQATIGGALLPLFLKFCDVLDQAIGFMTDTAKWIQKNSDVIAPLAAAVGAITGLIIAWKIATAAWTAVTEIATAAQEALNVALDANPIGIVILALAGLAAALVVLWTRSETFRNIVLTAWNDVRNTTVTVWNAIKDFFEKWWPALLAIATGGVGLIVVMIVKHWDDIVSATTGAWDKVRNATTAVWDGIKAFLTGWWPGLVASVRGAAGDVVDAVTAKWNAVRSTTTGVWDAVKSIVSGAVNAVRASVSGVFGAIGGIVASAAGAVRAGVGAIVGTFNGIISVLNAIVGAAEAAASAIDSVVNAAGKIKDVGGSIIHHIPGFASGVRDFAGGMAVVGENGPELVNLPAGADVFTNDESRQMLGGGKGINIENLNVREEADVYRVAAQLGRQLAVSV